MKRILWLLIFSTQLAVAQKLKKADKIVITNLQSHITFLADDKLEGRRTGSNGEKLAYEYISKEFGNAGLTPKGENSTYLQSFEVNDGKEVNKVSHLIINDHDLKLNEEYFPQEAGTVLEKIKATVLANEPQQMQASPGTPIAPTAPTPP